jgi:hypothetical protein
MREKLAKTTATFAKSLKDTQQLALQTSLDRTRRRREDAKSHEAMTAAHTNLIRTRFAASLALKCLKYLREVKGTDAAARLATAISAAIVKDSGLKSRYVPSFFNGSNRVGLLVISPNTSNSDTPVYASEHFSWQLLHKAPATTKASDPAPSTRIGAILKRCCPGFATLLGNRFTGATLLLESHQSADLAFFMGVWRYSHALPHGVFPCGFSDWPLSLEVLSFLGGSPGAASSSSAQPSSSAATS